MVSITKAMNASELRLRAEEYSDTATCTMENIVAARTTDGEKSASAA